jgi:hypothetical protein
MADDRGANMILGSKRHTEGDSILWTVNYEKWLDDNAALATVNVQSSSTTLTVGTITVLGPEVKFLLIGGTENERATVTLTMTDNLGNVKHDSIAFTVVAP